MARSPTAGTLPHTSCSLLLVLPHGHRPPSSSSSPIVPTHRQAWTSVVANVTYVVSTEYGEYGEYGAQASWSTLSILRSQIGASRLRPGALAECHLKLMSRFPFRWRFSLGGTPGRYLDLPTYLPVLPLALSVSAELGRRAS